jgi:dynein heavy chain
MNPGYAGRQELPENLKVQFRGVCMMVPDRREIMKTFLATSGYTTMDDLSIKFNIVYRQCEEQLSKQRHYDFGLRNIKSVLRQAGNILRLELDRTREKEGIAEVKPDELKIIEERLMYKALKDMNLSKLVKDDIPLFTSLLDDVFVNIFKENKPDKDVQDTSVKFISDIDLISDALDKDPWLNKILQLYDTNTVRHAFMLVGPTGSGKSEIIKVLTNALTNISSKRHEEKGSDKEVWVVQRLNPRSITQDQLYGERDESGEF